MVASAMIPILFLGWVGLVASSVKVYYIDDDARSPQSYNSKPLKSYNRIRQLETMVKRMQQLQANIPKYNTKDDVTVKNRDYDYDGYYYFKSNISDKPEKCKGDKCPILVPGKTPWIIREAKPNSREVNRNYEGNSELKSGDDPDSGYERDVESDEPVPESTRKKTLNNEAPTKPTYVDIDKYIPNSFKGRSWDDDNKISKLSTDYLDIDDIFMRTYSNKNLKDRNNNFQKDIGESSETQILRALCANAKKNCQLKNKSCHKTSPACKLKGLAATTNATSTTRGPFDPTIRNGYLIRYITPKPTIATTTTRKKTFDEKTTAEITSADLQMYIPDSFEQRAGKDEDEYLDVDYFLRTYAKKNNTNRDKKLNLSEKIPKKELFKSLRTKNANFHDNSRKWVRIKNKENKKKENKKESSDSDSESKRDNDSNDEEKNNKKQQNKKKTKQKDSNSRSDDENDSNTSQEKSTEYYKKPKQSKYQKETENKKLKRKKPARFEIIDSLNAYTSDSEEPRYFINQKGSTETIEPVSVEVKVKPKKLSRPRIPNKPEHYLQGPSRLYKEGRDFRKKKGLDNLPKNLRKRMPHFLPKRYHWDPRDFQRLGYFWFNGPQGKVPGPWKIAY